MASYEAASNICQALTIVDVVVLLIAAGAGVRVGGSDWFTPLDLAVAGGHEGVAQKLRAAGATKRSEAGRKKFFGRKMAHGHESYDLAGDPNFANAVQ